MAKQGMARPDWAQTQPRNDARPVAEIQGKAKHGKKKARPLVEGEGDSQHKVYHAWKGDGSNGS